MPSDPEVPSRFGPQDSDPTLPSPARVYDYVLGGDNHYAVDRQAAEAVLRIMPSVGLLARYNRQWMQRVVRALTADGVRQFIDIGSGLPAAGQVHEIARKVVSDPVRVVYVDYERSAVTRGNAILADDPDAVTVLADMRQPNAVLGHEEVAKLIDRSQPVALIWASMLHFIEDRDKPFEIVAQYADWLKTGDFLALSHSTEHFMPSDRLAQMRAARDKYNETVSARVTIRPLDQIKQFFAGADILEPGLVPLPDWRPDEAGYAPDPDDLSRLQLVGGVARVR